MDIGFDLGSSWADLPMESVNVCLLISRRLLKSTAEQRGKREPFVSRIISERSWPVQRRGSSTLSVRAFAVSSGGCCPRQWPQQFLERGTSIESNGGRGSEAPLHVSRLLQSIRLEHSTKRDRSPFL